MGRGLFEPFDDAEWQTIDTPVGDKHAREKLSEALV